jgi:4-aminobutyrate aminotransferase-like enzyme
MAGVELVMDRASREPAAALADRAKNAMADHGVLIGTTGRHGNVLKIRPPLCLSVDQAGLIATTLDEVLTDLGG